MPIIESGEVPKHEFDVVVTGGAGFLGSAICRRLSAEGIAVLCIDNLSTGSFSRIEDIADEESFFFLNHDVVAPLGLRTRQIYNFACPASPKYYQENSVQTIATAVTGAWQVFDAGRRCGARVLQASSSEVYGHPSIHPQSESYLGAVDCASPRACYSEGKRSAESAFIAFHHQFGLEGAIARIFNVYGPGMSPADGRVIPTFVCRALQNQPLPIHGQGTQTRSFCFVDDLVDGVQGLMALAGNETRPVNIGNPNEISIMEIAREIVELTGSRSTMDFLPASRDEPIRRCPDISRARKVLGWEPAVDLADGLMATIEYFEDLLLRQGARKVSW